jgi:RNA polymerase sigma factor (sigma-70 family)
MSSVENKYEERMLWSKFLEGDTQGLSLIFMRYSSFLFDYGCRFTTDQDLVKDCIQEVFCTLIRTHKNLSDTDNVKLYLLKSVKRGIIRELKNSVNKPMSLDDHDYSFNLVWSENLENQITELAEEKMLLIADAMNSLTERQKEAIYLRFNRGLEYEEISSLLSLNYQSSRALIHRAIEKLREIVHVQEKKITQIFFSILFGNSKAVL